MLDIFKSLFGEKPSGSTETQPSNRIEMATCAVLLEIAYSDGDFSEVERTEIASILKNKFALSSENIGELISSAEEEIKKSIDVWSFSTQINKAFTIDEKLGLVEMVWKLVLADGYLDQHEEYLAKKLADLIGISHRQMIEAKRKALVGKK